MSVRTNLFLSLAAATALSAFAVDDSPATRRQDTPDKPLTGAEIVAKPRRATTKTPVPELGGCYVGSGVYGRSGKMGCTGFCFTNWSCEKLDAEEAVDLCAKEEVGNTVQFWTSNERLLRLADQAKKKGLYVTCIYSRATNGMVRTLVKNLGDRWLGHDFGERFEFSLYQNWDKRGVSLRGLADEYMNRVHKHVNDLHAEGWGNVMATSGNFGLDYEVAAGTEVPCTEDYPFGDLTLASALGRGLYRQYDLPVWGSHLAHDWYSFLSFRNPYKMRSFSTALYHKYMTGAKIIINECGNWEQQSTLCEDSPHGRLPITHRKYSDAWKKRAELNTPEVLAAAKKKFAYIDYRSPVVVKYRKALADFYAFCKEHPCPKGQPEATWALAKGNFDLSSGCYIPASAICAAYDLAEKSPAWYDGLPEMSWDVVRKAVMPMPPMFGAEKNHHFSGSPYGLCDIVSFAYDNVTAEHLLKNYKVLMFSGWNTCSKKQYKVLCDYVKGGGILVIGLCHLSTDEARNYYGITPQMLVNGGDLTDLCGFRVKGKTPRRYWATGPSTKRNDAGFIARRRFGFMCLPLGDLEYRAADGTYVKDAPQDRYEMLAVDDEEEDPFIIRCKTGKGQVLFMNWWGYPAMANMDVGPGAETRDLGMAGYLYQYAAKLGRGNVFITGRDFENPDADCDWILYSYFPDAGQVCMMNLDYENERSCVLQQFGDKEFVTLAPGEFRIIESVKLDPDEKLNVE